MKNLNLALVATLTTFAIGFTACSQSPTGRRQLELVPESQVRQMGDQAWAELKQKTPESKNAAAKDFAHRVAARVVEATPLKGQPWDVVVFDSQQINAFALPGGHIGVYAGILPVAQNEAGLATVLGHEIGHVVANHSGERVSQEAVASGIVSEIGSAFGQSQYHNVLLGALGLGTQVGVLLPYSRKQESEADQIGLGYLAKAGYDPKEALAFWNRMKSSTGGHEPPAFLSDHPATDERIQRLRELLPQAEKDYASAIDKRGAGDRYPAGSR